VTGKYNFHTGSVLKNGSVESKIWSLDEARKALPRILRMTQRAFQESSTLANEISQRILPENIMEEKEGELQAVLSEWAIRIMRLGAEVKGLWLIDFDNGKGYYCWRFGEDDILFEHSYESGFFGRRPIGSDGERGGERDAANDN
jgi:hypothetical protein